MKQKFRAKLTSKGPGGAWIYLPIPFDVHRVFGSRGRVPVSGMINGYPFHNTLMPEDDGTHFLMVGKELQSGAQASVGDMVYVVLERDHSERAVTMPEELREALDRNTQAASVFATLTPSQKKEYVDWISTAKHAATKARRAAKAVEMLAEGKKHL